MAISLTIDLSDRDLEHFTKAMEAAKAAAAHKSAEDVVAAAGALLADAQKVHVPDFIRERLVRLDDMIAMVRDEGWSMEADDRQRVMSVLVYFADPKDVIPDHVEVLGFLDDAIMIELSVRELQHELDAYDDFCDFREREAGKRGVAPAEVGHADWLDSRREELFERMHARRERDYGVGYGSSSGYRSKSNYVRAWRPSLFKFG
jgi:uncharacterized membrane protein YkvA (DUF1232 family)